MYKVLMLLYVVIFGIYYEYIHSVVCVSYFALRWWKMNQVYLSNSVACINLFIESHLSYFVMPSTLLIT